MGNLPADITSVELQNSSLYPHAHKALPPITVIQGPGEVVFVPRYVLFHNCIFDMAITVAGIIK